MPERYAQLLAGTRLNERPLLSIPTQHTEIELQARWFAGDFGRIFTSTTGDSIQIVQFGTWNRAAGPDFSDAAVRINGQDLVRGSIEFDLTDQNWEAHGHAINSEFDSTVLHVFVASTGREFFTRTSNHRLVPQVRVDPLTLPAIFSSNVPLARAGRCHAPLCGLPEEKISGILEGAAQFRLQRKTQRLAQLADLHGLDEALFQEMAAAFGYKENKLPFTLIAQRLTLGALRRRPHEAVLFGVAGFLAAPDLAGFQEEARSYLRILWDAWWRERDEFGRLVLPMHVWRLSGTRPSNHPQRRLAALGQLVREWPSFRRCLSREDLAPLRKYFLGLRHPYWNFHYTLSSPPSAAALALIGASRTTEILANVVLPWRQLRGRNVWAEYAQLPASLTNRRLETGAARLFGNDQRRARFLRRVMHQQGLLQIYEDFCLQDDSDCAQCPFPEQMRKWI